MEKEYKHKFAGISSNDDKPFEDVFDVIERNYQTICISKNSGVAYLGSKTIQFKVVVDIQDMSEYDDNKEIYTAIYIVPFYKNLHKHNREKLFGEVCDDISEKEYADSKWYYTDALDYGMSVFLTQEGRKYRKNTYNKVIETIKGDIANTSSAYLGLIGFYLDKPINRIGMNGWDYLRQYCNNVKMTTIIKELKKRY